MINQKDVIRMKVPFPTINDNLAVKSHMYICRTHKSYYHEFVKCQTLKPYMLFNNPMKHFVDEPADINRNPFVHATRIDCDKVFATYNVTYADILKTTLRSNISNDVFELIEHELLADGFIRINISENDLKSLNSFIN